MASTKKGFKGKTKRQLKYEAFIKRENRKLDLERKLKSKTKSS